MGPGRVFASWLEISGPGLFLCPEPELPEFLSSSEAYPELPAVRGSGCAGRSCHGDSCDTQTPPSPLCLRAASQMCWNCFPGAA